jgi:hypothetical protein
MRIGERKKYMICPDTWYIMDQLKINSGYAIH